MLERKALKKKEEELEDEGQHQDVTEMVENEEAGDDQLQSVALMQSNTQR